jgi:hypothetical protein
MKQGARFQIIDPTGTAEEVTAPGITPGAVLLKTQRRAEHAERDGRWIVREYEDDLYAVERTAEGAVETRTL